MSYCRAQSNRLLCQTSNLARRLQKIRGNKNRKPLSCVLPESGFKFGDDLKFARLPPSLLEIRQGVRFFLIKDSPFEQWSTLALLLSHQIETPYKSVYIQFACNFAFFSNALLLFQFAIFRPSFEPQVNFFSLR